MCVPLEVFLSENPSKRFLEGKARNVLNYLSEDDRRIIDLYIEDLIAQDRTNRATALHRSEVMQAWLPAIGGFIFFTVLSAGSIFTFNSCVYTKEKIANEIKSGVDKEVGSIQWENEELYRHLTPLCRMYKGYRPDPDHSKSPSQE